VAGHLAALGAFFALAVAWTWPLGRHLTSRVGPDAGDPVLNAWILWWNSQAVPFTDHWWSPPIFFPLEGAFALSEHLAGIALFTVPFQLAGLSPLGAANSALILSFALSAFFTYLLVRRLLAASGLPPFTIAAAAFCAGMAFGFAPYRAGQLSHLQVLTTQWMPLALLGMHGYLADGRWRWLALTAFAWVVQALSNGYYLIFFPVLVAGWFAWFVGFGRQWRRGAVLLASYAAASLLLLPGLLQYLMVHQQLGLERHITEMRVFSGDLRAFLTPPHGLVFWPDLAFANQETFLFPGVTALALVALALVLRRGLPPALYPLPFYASAALVMWWLSLGPALPEDGLPARLRLYTLLAELPGFGGLRVPARFAMLGYLCLAVAAGLALARLLPSAPRARASSSRWFSRACSSTAGRRRCGSCRRRAGHAAGGREHRRRARTARRRRAGERVGDVSRDAPRPAARERLQRPRPAALSRSCATGCGGGTTRSWLRWRSAVRSSSPWTPARDADGHFRRVVEACGRAAAGRHERGEPVPGSRTALVVRPPVGDPLTYAQSQPAHDIAELDFGRPKPCGSSPFLSGGTTASCTRGSRSPPRTTGSTGRPCGSTGRGARRCWARWTISARCRFASRCPTSAPDICASARCRPR
jgi:hypothetical protein